MNVEVTLTVIVIAQSISEGVAAIEKRIGGDKKENPAYVVNISGKIAKQQ